MLQSFEMRSRRSGSNAPLAIKYGMLCGFEERQASDRAPYSFAFKLGTLPGQEVRVCARARVTERKRARESSW